MKLLDKIKLYKDLAKINALNSQNLSSLTTKYFSKFKMTFLILSLFLMLKLGRTFMVLA